MDIRSLKADACDAVSRSPGAKQVALIYAALTVVFSALVTVVSYCLELEIGKTGGLSNIGLRSVLSSVQTMLPLVQSVVMVCLEVGFLSAVLRMVRGQYVSPNSLRMGFARFWPLMRMLVLQSMIYMGVGLISSFLAVQIFMLTPLSRSAMAMAESLAATGDLMSLDEASLMGFMKTLLPMLPILAVIYLVVFLPIFYRLRMASYVIIDKPAAGALHAMRESRMMLRGNCLKLARLDLSFWWFYLLTVLSMVVAYGDMLLPLVGVELPWSDTVSYFLFYGLFLAMQFGLFYCFLTRVTAAYALTYDVIRPQEKPTQGVVLGNIFDLARDQ